MALRLTFACAPYERMLPRFGGSVAIPNVRLAPFPIEQPTLASQRCSGSLRYMLPWLRESLEEVDEVFGGDVWPYGIEENRAAMSAFGRYLVEDRLLDELPDVDDLFGRFEPAAERLRR